MDQKKDKKTTDSGTRKPYEKPVVETEEVLERQVLGTGPTPGNPACK